MDPNIIAASVAVVSAVATSIISTFAAYRKLKKELQLTHRSELIRKQMEACEQMWQALAMVSFSPGDNRILKDDGSCITVSRENAQDFINNIISIFYSTVGIYLSRNVREKLFDLRDFIVAEFLYQNKGRDFLDISKTKARKFRSKINKLRIAIRAEIGVEDLNVAKVIGSEIGHN